MKKSDIRIDVNLDENHVPETISWSASDSADHQNQPCKAVFANFWDPNSKSTMRIDLWTKDMTVDEMKHFFVQSMLSMADTFDRATGEKEHAEALRKFSKAFGEKLKVLKAS